MSEKPQTVVDLREERNARLIPRDPRRAIEYDKACAEVVANSMRRIREGGDPLENRFLIALASGTLEDLERCHDLLQRRKRSGLRVVSSSSVSD